MSLNSLVSQIIEPKDVPIEVAKVRKIAVVDAVPTLARKRSPRDMDPEYQDPRLHGLRTIVEENSVDWQMVVSDITSKNIPQTKLSRAMGLSHTWAGSFMKNHVVKMDYATGAALIALHKKLFPKARHDSVYYKRRWSNKT